MRAQDYINYQRIAQAIDYIKINFKEQPTLDELAAHVHLSPFHFQRLFTDWVGTSPKKFLQYTTITYAKHLLKKKQATLFDTAHEAGLSGTGRLHDLFINIEGMTPAAYKNGGSNLQINYEFDTCPFGKVLIASTDIGICYLSFIEEEEPGLQVLRAHFPNATFTLQSNSNHQNAMRIFSEDWSNINQVKLHLKGTDFQLKVWEALIKIPLGQLTTYGSIAGAIDQPSASRAVGTAIGSNPVAYLIPCHRVVQSSGVFGGYMWGNTRKTAIIGWEGVKQHVESFGE